MDIKQRQLIKKYVDIVLAKWWLIVSSVLIAVTIAQFYYLRIPKVYKSTALLSYEQQQINPARMDPEQGRSGLREALGTLKELVTSQSNLEKIITQLSLYEKARERVPLQGVIGSMRRSIEIVPVGQGDVFSVSFQGGDPEEVVKVTNALAALFIEENLKYREERASETSKYTEKELALAKKVLDEKEQVMRDYKLEYFNEMPEQRPGNLAQLQALVTQNQGYQNTIQELERTKAMLQEQVGMQQRLAAMQMAIEAPTGSAGARFPETNAERLRRLRAYLNSLLTKYTKNHPEVLHTQQQIRQLEKLPSGASAVSGRSTAGSQASLTATMEAQRLQIQLREIDINIRQIRDEQAKIPGEIAKYQRWIEAAPIREAEWNNLTRDYTELRRHYDQLVAQNLQAQSAENLERNQKGSKFKIADPARLPEKPFKPNFLRILLVALAAGLGVSVGSLVILDFIDTSFKDVGELEEYIGVPVICALPFIEKEEEALKEKRKNILLAGGVSLYAIVLFAALIVMYAKGMIII
ncbi:MAG: hypothetical protein GXY53_02125 [Desulfobulbus sp.]|nr:hypothetical protein [Desulfobulbus sp.]